MTPTTMFIVGLAAFITAIVGAVVAIRKLGPETKGLEVNTSQALVAMAKANADMHRTDAADLRERNKALDDRLTEYANKLGEATARIEALEAKAAEVDRLRTQVESLRRERDEALTAADRFAEENAELLERVDNLESEVAQLRQSSDDT